MASPMIRILAQREDGDCGIASLAMVLGVTYGDILEAAAHIKRRPHRAGLYTRELRSIAERLGITLHRRRTYDLDADSGVLIVKLSPTLEHAVVLHDGKVIDPSGPDLWDADVYVATKRAKLGELLVIEEHDKP